MVLNLEQFMGRVCSVAAAGRAGVPGEPGIFSRGGQDLLCKASVGAVTAPLGRDAFMDRASVGAAS